MVRKARHVRPSLDENDGDEFVDAIDERTQTGASLIAAQTDRVGE
jgi:hypothetical protein